MAGEPMPLRGPPAAPRAAPVATDGPPAGLPAVGAGGLPAAVLAVLRGLPNGDLLPAQRLALLRADAPFATAMRRIEGRGLPARSLAELWLWAAHLTLDIGSRPSTTVRSYVATAARWLAWCEREGVDFAEADVNTFERWQRWLALELRNGANWRSQQLMALRNFYDWRRAHGLAERNQAADVRGPRVKPRPARKYTTEQLRQVFRTIDAGDEARRRRDRCLVLLLLTTGMRREELASLSLSDIELGKNVATIRIHGKGSKQRDVPIEGPVVVAIRDLLEELNALPYPRDPDALLLSISGRTRGQRLTVRGVDYFMRDLAARSRLREWGVHRFRVTFATQLYDDGADIETIRALMGHETIETTRRYLAVSERARRTRLGADRQHSVLGTKQTGRPLWARLAAGEVLGD